MKNAVSFLGLSTRGTLVGVKEDFIDENVCLIDCQNFYLAIDRLCLLSIWETSQSEAVELSGRNKRLILDPVSRKPFTVMGGPSRLIRQISRLSKGSG